MLNRKFSASKSPTFHILTVGVNSKNMRVNLKRIIPLLAIIGLMACNENSKPNSENSSLDSQTSDLKSENTHISEEFNWNIINSEKDEPYFEPHQFDNMLLLLSFRRTSFPFLYS